MQTDTTHTEPIDILGSLISLVMMKQDY